MTPKPPQNEGPEFQNLPTASRFELYGSQTTSPFRTHFLSHSPRSQMRNNGFLPEMISRSSDSHPNGSVNSVRTNVDPNVNSRINNFGHSMHLNGQIRPKTPNANGIMGSSIGNSSWGNRNGSHNSANGIGWGAEKAPGLSHRFSLSLGGHNNVSTIGSQIHSAENGNRLQPNATPSMIGQSVQPDDQHDVRFSFTTKKPPSGLGYSTISRSSRGGQRQSWAPCDRHLIQRSSSSGFAANFDAPPLDNSEFVRIPTLENVDRNIPVLKITHPDVDDPVDHFSDNISANISRKNHENGLGTQNRRSHSQDTEMLTNGTGKSETLQQRNYSHDSGNRRYSAFGKWPPLAQPISSPSPPLRRNNRRQHRYSAGNHEKSSASNHRNSIESNPVHPTWIAPSKFENLGPKSNSNNFRTGSNGYKASEIENNLDFRESMFPSNYQTSKTYIPNYGTPIDRTSHNCNATGSTISNFARFRDNDSDCETLQDRFQRDWELFQKVLPSLGPNPTQTFFRKLAAPRKLDNFGGNLGRMQYLSRSEGDLAETASKFKDIHGPGSTQLRNHIAARPTSADSTSSSSLDDGQGRVYDRINENAKSIDDRYFKSPSNAASSHPVKRSSLIVFPTTEKAIKIDGQKSRKFSIDELGNQTNLSWINRGGDRRIKLTNQRRQKDEKGGKELTNGIVSERGSQTWVAKTPRNSDETNTTDGVRFNNQGRQGMAAEYAGGASDKTRPYGNSTISKKEAKIKQKLNSTSSDISEKLRNSFSTLERSKLARQLLRSPSKERLSSKATVKTLPPPDLVHSTSKNSLSRNFRDANCSDQKKSSPKLYRKLNYSIFPADILTEQQNSRFADATSNKDTRSTVECEPTNERGPTTNGRLFPPNQQTHACDTVNNSDYSQSDLDSILVRERKNGRKRVQFVDEITGSIKDNC